MIIPLYVKGTDVIRGYFYQGYLTGRQKHTAKFLTKNYCDNIEAAKCAAVEYEIGFTLLKNVYASQDKVMNYKRTNVLHLAQGFRITYKVRKGIAFPTYEIKQRKDKRYFYLGIATRDFGVAHQMAVNVYLDRLPSQEYRDVYYDILMARKPTLKELNTLAKIHAREHNCIARLATHD